MATNEIGGNMKRCQNCEAMNEVQQTYCRMCGSTEMVADAAVAEAAKAEEEAQAAILEQAAKMKVVTVERPVEFGTFECLGLVFGNSSKQAFWGLSTQANRLSRAYDAALLNLKYDAAVMGADAVVGVHFALNNSTGSGANLITGSSEAVMLLGTAIKLQK